MGNRFTRYLTFLPFLLALSLKADVFRVDDLAGGLHDNIPGHMIADNEATELVNFHIDPYSRGLDQRKGSAKKNSTQLAGKKAVDVFTLAVSNGSEYLLAITSNTIAYSGDNGANFNTLITTATDGAQYDAVQFPNDRLYIVSQADGGFYFDGSALVATTQTPKGKFIEKFQNRIWVGNTAANPNRLFFSGLLLPSTFTVSTDWIDFPEPLTGIGKPFDSGLPIYTANQTWVLRGDSPGNFYIQQIADNIGCAHDRTIQNMNIGDGQYQIFLSKGENQTSNNLYALTGTSVKEIGNRILTTLSSLNISNSSVRQQVWDTQSDWNAGTFTNTTGTYTVGSVIISTNNTNVLNNGFEDGTGINADNWTLSPYSIGRTNGAARTGAFGEELYKCCTFDVFPTVIYCDITLRYYILDANLNVLETAIVANSNTGGDCFSSTSFVLYSVNLSAYRGMNISIKFNVKLNNSGSNYSSRSDNFLCSGNSISFYWRRSNPNNLKSFQIDDVEGGRSTISSGTYTSQDIQTDTNLTQWGTFDVDQELNNGLMTFYVKTATSSATLASASYRTITPGLQISTTTDQFFKWKVDIASGTATNLTNIRLNKVTANWISNSGASQPLGSTIFKGDYWLTYTGPGQSRNQSILFMNREGKFAGPTEGLNAYSLTVSNGRLFAGDSSTDTVNGGYVWEYETGNTDAGTAITSKVTFKNQQFPGLEDYEKNLSLIYFTYGVDVGNFTATIKENFNEFSNNYNVYFASGTLYNRAKLELNQQTTGRHFSLGFTNSYSGSRLKLYPPITYHFEKSRLIPPGASDPL